MARRLVMSSVTLFVVLSALLTTRIHAQDPVVEEMSLEEDTAKFKSQGIHMSGEMTQSYASAVQFKNDCTEGSNKESCPYSQLAWSRGTFVPAAGEEEIAVALVRRGGLTLTISLCCTFKFKAEVARNATLWAHTMELMFRSPFSSAEARAMFPHGSGTVSPDLSVMTLTSKPLPNFALKNIHTYSERGEYTNPTWASVDLKVPTFALDCKCQASLIVGPGIKLSADKLQASWTIVGSGVHCANRTQDNDENKLMGTLAAIKDHPLSLSPPLPPLGRAEWTIWKSQRRPEVDKAAVEEALGDEISDEESSSGGAVGAHMIRTGPDGFRLPNKIAEYDDAPPREDSEYLYQSTETSFDNQTLVIPALEPNVRYVVRVVIFLGEATPREVTSPLVWRQPYLHKRPAHQRLIIEPQEPTLARPYVVTFRNTIKLKVPRQRKVKNWKGPPAGYRGIWRAVVPPPREERVEEKEANDPLAGETHTFLEDWGKAQDFWVNTNDNSAVVNVTRVGEDSGILYRVEWGVQDDDGACPVYPLYRVDIAPLVPMIMKERKCTEDPADDGGIGKWQLANGKSGMFVNEPISKRVVCADATALDAYPIDLWAQDLVDGNWTCRDVSKGFDHPEAATFASGDAVDATHQIHWASSSVKIATVLKDFYGNQNLFPNSATKLWCNYSFTYRHVTNASDMAEAEVDERLRHQKVFGLPDSGTASVVLGRIKSVDDSDFMLPEVELSTKKLSVPISAPTHSGRWVIDTRVTSARESGLKVEDPVSFNTTLSHTSTEPTLTYLFWLTTVGPCQDYAVKVYVNITADPPTRAAVAQKIFYTDEGCAHISAVPPERDEGGGWMVRDATELELKANPGLTESTLLDLGDPASHETRLCGMQPQSTAFVNWTVGNQAGMLQDSAQVIRCVDPLAAIEMFDDNEDKTKDVYRAQSWIQRHDGKRETYRNIPTTSPVGALQDDLSAGLHVDNATENDGSPTTKFEQDENGDYAPVMEEPTPMEDLKSALEKEPFAYYITTSSRVVVKLITPEIPRSVLATSEAAAFKVHLQDEAENPTTTIREVTAEYLTVSKEEPTKTLGEARFFEITGLTTGVTQLTATVGLPQSQPLLGVCSRAEAVMTIHAVIPRDIVESQSVTCQPNAHVPIETFRISPLLASANVNPKVEFDFVCATTPATTAAVETAEDGMTAEQQEEAASKAPDGATTTTTVHVSSVDLYSTEVVIPQVPVGNTSCFLKVSLVNTSVSVTDQDSAAAARAAAESRVLTTSQYNFLIMRKDQKLPNAIVAGRVVGEMVTTGQAMSRRDKFTVVGSDLEVFAMTDSGDGTPLKGSDGVVKGTWDFTFVPVRQSKVGHTEKPLATDPRRSSSTRVELLTTSGNLGVAFIPTHSGSEAPSACPGEKATTQIFVLLAEVDKLKYIVCGEKMMIKATPLPKAVKSSFFGRWVVDTEASTASLSGLKMNDPLLPNVTLTGLGTGHTFISWSIFSKDQPDVPLHSVQVTLKTITDNLNLPDHRVTTLLEHITLPTSVSTVDWALKLPPGDKRSLRDEDGEIGANKLGTLELVASGGTIVGDRLHNATIQVKHLPYGRTTIQYRLISKSPTWGVCHKPTLQLLHVERIDLHIEGDTNVNNDCDVLEYNHDTWFSLQIIQTGHTEGLPRVTFHEDRSLLENLIRRERKKQTPIFFLESYTKWDRIVFEDEGTKVKVHFTASMYAESAPSNTQPFNHMQLNSEILAGLSRVPEVEHHPLQLDIGSVETFGGVAHFDAWTDSVRTFTPQPDKMTLREVDIAAGLVNFTVEVSRFGLQLFPNAKKASNMTDAFLQSLDFCSRYFLSTSFHPNKAKDPDGSSPWHGMASLPIAGCRMLSTKTLIITVYANDDFVLGRESNLDVKVPKAILCGVGSTMKDPTFPPTETIIPVSNNVQAQAALEAEAKMLEPFYKNNLKKLGSITINDDPIVNIDDLSTIRECDLEENKIKLHLKLQGAAFADFTSDEEFRSKLSLLIPKTQRPDRGVGVCRQTMIQNASFHRVGKKQLQVTFGACPQLVMTHSPHIESEFDRNLDCDGDSCFEDHTVDSHKHLRRLAVPETLIMRLKDGTLTEGHLEDVEHTLVVQPTIAIISIVRTGQDARSGTYICEDSIKTHGFTVGIRLRGDTWSSLIGDWTSPNSLNDLIAKGFKVQRSPSVVSSFDYGLQAGTETSSPFMRYIEKVSRGQHVVKVNSSYVEIRIPSRTEAIESMRHRRERVPYSVLNDVFLPQEEISFAIPGPAVACPACYGSSTSFSVLGMGAAAITIGSSDHKVNDVAIDVNPRVTWEDWIDPTHLAQSMPTQFATQSLCRNPRDTRPVSAADKKSDAEVGDDEDQNQDSAGRTLYVPHMEVGFYNCTHEVNANSDSLENSGALVIRTGRTRTIQFALRLAKQDIPKTGKLPASARLPTVFATTPQVGPSFDLFARHCVMAKILLQDCSPEQCNPETGTCDTTQNCQVKATRRIDLVDPQKEMKRLRLEYRETRAKKQNLASTAATATYFFLLTLCWFVFGRVFGTILPDRTDPSRGSPVASVVAAIVAIAVTYFVYSQEGVPDAHHDKMLITAFVVGWGAVFVRTGLGPWSWFPIFLCVLNALVVCVTITEWNPISL